MAVCPSWSPVLCTPLGAILRGWSLLSPIFWWCASGPCCSFLSCLLHSQWECWKITERKERSWLLQALGSKYFAGKTPSRCCNMILRLCLLSERLYEFTAANKSHSGKQHQRLMLMEQELFSNLKVLWLAVLHSRFQTCTCGNRFSLCWKP